MTMGIYGSRTKKELKTKIGQSPSFIETSMFGPEYEGKNGDYVVVGPSPLERKWFAKVSIVDGKISKVS